VLPYVLPFALYLGLTQVPSPTAAGYAVQYAAVVLVVGLATAALLRGRRLLQPHGRVLPGILVGLAGIALWIGLSRLGLERELTADWPAWLRPQPRPAFNPFASLAEPLVCWGFVAVRLAGLALLVPVAEELFWRGFLLRWLTAADWQERPPGQFTPLAFAGVTFLFTLAHPEWLAAAVYCALLNGLLRWTGDLWNCVVAHGVSNLALGVYVLTTGTWELW
jgi:CAAX prenyl protease-like protein